MPRKEYNLKLSNQEVIDLCSTEPCKGKYLVNTELGTIEQTRGRPIFTFSNKFSDHLWCRLFKYPKYRTIAVSHIIWMVATQTPLPPGWEVHHHDQNPTNNPFENLIALHPKDHRKLHRLEEAPF